MCQSACAMALAAPLIYAQGLMETWRRGIVLKSCAVFEKMAQINTIVSDKTGTLTLGKPQVLRAAFSQSHLFDSEIQVKFFARIQLAAAQSSHPVSQALQEFLSDSYHGVVLLSCREIAGCGLVAHFEGFSDPLYIGKPQWVSEMLGQNFDSPLNELGLVAASQGRLNCFFTLQETLRADSKSTVQSWLASGKRVLIASGDSKDAVARIGSELNIPPLDCFAELLPHQKLEIIKQLQSNKATHILVLGDGINDTPCLAQADVGIAVRNSVDVAASSADVFLRQDSLCNVESLFHYSKYLHRSLAFALAVSISFNLVAIFFAASGHLHPLIAALIMPLSSVSTLLIATFRKGNSTWKSCSYSSLLR